MQQRHAEHAVQEGDQTHEVEREHLLLVWSHVSVEEGIWILCELSS